jgi:hypothetical protein
LPSLVPHVALSSAVGVATWASTGEVVAIPAALIAGVLPDVDHLLDYYLWWIKGERRFLILFLHGWEYLLLGAVIYLLWVDNIWMLATVLGYASQIGADQLFNRPQWHTYLISVRASRCFKSKKSNAETLILASDNSLIASLPFGKTRVRNWLEKKGTRGQSPPHHRDADSK